MAGTFRSGDLLFIEPGLVSALHPGDVVVYKDPQRPHDGVNTAHRVIGIKPQGLICRGDNNPLPDLEPLPEERLIGRVTRFERGGRVRKVRGGRLGLWQARMLWARRGVWRAIAAPLRPLYRRLRKSGLVAALWKPETRRIRFCSPDGEYVKYVRHGRTVAVWRPARNECRFRKPFDLVLWREIARERDRAAAESRGLES
jgi:signal peptidase I